jgi:uncharacterized membrane protein
MIDVCIGKLRLEASEGRAEIIEQTSDQRIAWRTQAGAIINGGVVSFIWHGMG